MKIVRQRSHRQPLGPWSLGRLSHLTRPGLDRLASPSSMMARTQRDRNALSGPGDRETSSAGNIDCARARETRHGGESVLGLFVLAILFVFSGGDLGLLNERL